MINRIIKFVFALPIIVVLVVTVILNVRLHTVYVNPDKDLILELRNLKRGLDNHADAEMQKLYPEGYLFYNALYGLAWCNYLTYFSKNDSTGEAHREIQRAFNNVYSESGHTVFYRDLSIPYGAFYSGWSNYLLGKKLSIEDAADRRPEDVVLFNQQCDTIAKVLSTKTFPASYPGKAWPADAVLCISSLALHDRLFEAKYEDVIRLWVISVKKFLDKNGLIPHEVVLASGKVLQEARGSSQSLMMAFLDEIDDEFAHEQFVRYKEKFLDSRLGLIGIREYPSGHYGLGDIDSGPVVLQMGGSATIAGLYSISYFGDNAAGKLYREIEALGLAYHNDDQKNYLFGTLPIADAFIAWSHSASSMLNTDDSNFMTFHLYGVLICSVCIITLWLFWGKRNKKRMHLPW